jgi:hypothetical protein
LNSFGDSSSYFADNVKRRRGRIFHVIKSGFTRADHFHRHLRVLHLTSCVGFDRSLLSRCFQVLRKRIEHEFHFSMEYVKVNTGEGNGVIHCVYFPVGLDGSSVGFNVGFLPQRWLSEAWADITGGSSVVWISDLHARSGAGRLVSYLVSQYFSGQSALERVSYSNNWVFHGFRRLWRKVFARSYFVDKVKCLIDWDLLLYSELSFIRERFKEFFVDSLPKYRSFDGI